MTHQTLTSLKDKQKCCPLKSLTAKQSGTREHKVNKTISQGGGEEHPELGKGKSCKNHTCEFFIFVLPWKRFYLSLTLKLQNRLVFSQTLGSFKQSFFKRFMIFTGSSLFPFLIKDSKLVHISLETLIIWRQRWHTESVQFSCSVVSDSLWPHGLQHARPPCPSPTPRIYSNSGPLRWWCHPTISSSVGPFSFHLQSFPASGSL